MISVFSADLYNKPHIYSFVNTDGQTDGWMDGGDCNVPITFFFNKALKKMERGTDGRRRMQYLHRFFF